MIDKDILYDLYIVQNKTRVEVASILSMSVSQIARYFVAYGIKKDPKQIAANISSTIRKKYGVDNISQLEEIKIKKREIALANYGTDTFLKTEEFKKKSKSSKLKKYGDENYNNRDKAKKYCLEKYSVDNVSKVKSIQDKRTATFLNRYNVTNASQLPEVKHKKEQTLLTHYGVNNPMLIPGIKNIVISRGYETRKKNGTFNGKGKIIVDSKEVSCSRAEEQGYNTLKTKFKDVQFQYKSEEYPFACDFYIPSLKLYIEFQITWEHCSEPYLGTEEQLKLVALYEQKSKKSKRYSEAIKIWTQKDVEKRNLAKQRNLNWIEFFSLDEFYVWFNQI